MNREIKVQEFQKNKRLTKEEIIIEKEKLTSLRKSMIKLLIKYNANTKVLDKDGKTLFEECLSNKNYILLPLFADTTSLKLKPGLIFSLSTIVYHPFIKPMFDSLLKNCTREDKIMEIIDDRGFSPFLCYIFEFLAHTQACYQRIHKYILFRIKKFHFQGETEFTKEKLGINYESYMDDFQANDDVTELIDQYYLYITYCC